MLLFSFYFGHPGSSTCYETVVGYVRLALRGESGRAHRVSPSTD